MSTKLDSLLWVFSLLYSIAEISSKYEFTSIKCTSLDTNFADFEYCYLKSVNRTYKYMSAKVNLFKTPITKIKRFSGYRPFMYNVTVDACRFLKDTPTNPDAGYSNMNNSCPYDHDLLFERISIDFVNQQVTKVTRGGISLRNQLVCLRYRAVVKVYGTLS
ncbi:Hypothetical predicted protein [Drosophila guanche]|uniref:MD-2-related lipid-recognition domain-containing protein n=1 Tax=Drosophila guanche TaxID=7266 RepID=A0A3B0JJA5_DROGU|nr:Hypothetical predicted protein [Drosophila guanche]